MTDIAANVNANVRQVTGNEGSYDSGTSAGKAANAGEEVGNLLKGGAKNVSTESDIAYTTVDNDGLDVEAGLAYSEEVVDALDENDDGGITLDSTEEAEATASNNAEAADEAVVEEKAKTEQQKAEEALGIADLAIADINADGKVDRSEYLSLTVLQDCVEEGADGIATAAEAVALNEYIIEESEDAKGNLEVIYNQLVKDVDADFEMPLTRIEAAEQKADEAIALAEENAEIAKEAIDKAATAEERAGAAEQKAKTAEQTAITAQKSADGAAQSAAKNAEQLADVQKQMQQIMQLMVLQKKFPNMPIEQLAQMIGLDLSEIDPSFLEAMSGSGMNGLGALGSLPGAFGSGMNGLNSLFAGLGGSGMSGLDGFGSLSAGLGGLGGDSFRTFMNNASLPKSLGFGSYSSQQIPELLLLPNIYN